MRKKFGFEEAAGLDFLILDDTFIFGGTAAPVVAGNDFAAAKRAAPAPIPDDYRDGIYDFSSALGSVAIGGSVSGRVETRGDKDVFAVSLVAGQTYAFDLARDGNGGLSNPYLRLQDAAGTQLAYNDNAGGSLNSSIKFTASATGTFYLQAGGATAGQIGSYTLSAQTAAPPPPVDDFRDSLTDFSAALGSVSMGSPVSGRLEARADTDIFSISLVGGHTYTFDLKSGATGGVADPYLRLLDTNGVQRALNDDYGGSQNSQITFTAATSGTFYLEARAYSAKQTGTYVLTAVDKTPAQVDDFRDFLADTSAPFGMLAVGAPRAGQIEMAGDKDIFSITLAAGKTYTFDLNGTGLDPSLSLLSAANVQLATNDNAGGSLNSKITFTATSAGVYYLEAGATTGTGGYTLAASEVISNPNPGTPTPTPGSFDIAIRYTGDARYQTAFDAAAARWERAITSDIPDYNSSRYGLIDDVLIDVRVVAIDGRYGTLGSAGPDEFRFGSWLPSHGSMDLDSADIESAFADGTLDDLIVHEMGHILGLGTLWDDLDLKSTSYQYIGANALAEYRVLSGNPSAAFVPLERSGGSGTAGAHWSEDVFNSEIMTGYLNGRLEMSRMTIAALKDLGYTVDLSAADLYFL